MRSAPARNASARVTAATVLITFRLKCGRALWRAFAACAMTLAFGSVQTTQASPVTYYYTGNPFTSQGNVNCPYSDCLNGDVMATVAYNGPGSFSFSLGAPGISLSSTSDTILSNEDFFNVANGTPTSWALALGSPASAPTTSQIVTDFGVSGYPTSGFDGTQYPLPSGELAFGFNSGSPGVWSMTPPPPSPSCSYILQHGAIIPQTDAYGIFAQFNVQPAGVTLGAAELACADALGLNPNNFTFNWQQTMTTVPQPYTAGVMSYSGEPPHSGITDPPQTGWNIYPQNCNTYPFVSAQPGWRTDPPRRIARIA
jgi:hypothetical protein